MNWRGEEPSTKKKKKEKFWNADFQNRNWMTKCFWPKSDEKNDECLNLSFTKYTVAKSSVWKLHNVHVQTIATTESFHFHSSVTFLANTRAPSFSNGFSYKVSPSW